METFATILLKLKIPLKKITQYFEIREHILNKIY